MPDGQHRRPCRFDNMKLVNILAYFLCALPSFFQGTLAANYTNPLRGFNGGDPQVVFYQGWYYMMSTNFNDLRMTRARTLDGLKTGEEKLVYADTNASRCCNVWAPEMCDSSRNCSCVRLISTF